MWWILGACLGAGLAGLELRRFLRDRAADRNGPRRYALYRSSDPERALGIIEFGADDAPPPGAAATEAAAGPPRPGADDPIAADATGATEPPGLPPYARRHHPPTSGDRRG